MSPTTCTTSTLFVAPRCAMAICGRATSAKRWRPSATRATSSSRSITGPLPPAENARKTVEYIGGADAVIARARGDFAKGEYRWVASAMNQVVFADPANRAARELGADALEQLGFQAEAATWRNAYLVGAMELRNGV